MLSTSFCDYIAIHTQLYYPCTTGIWENSDFETAVRELIGTCSKVGCSIYSYIFLSHAHLCATKGGQETLIRLNYFRSTDFFSLWNECFTVWVAHNF